jgi:hypothetical protein
MAFSLRGAHNGSVLNFGFGAMLVLVLLGVILVGTGKLSGPSSAPARVRSNAWRPGRERRRDEREPWSRLEWLILAAVLTLASLSLAIAGVRR